MQNAYTEDLADFGHRERHMAAALLAAGLPTGFYDDGVKLAMNRNSGYVFLVNSDFQVAMMNGNTIEQFYTTPYSGLEGFIGDLLAENEPNEINSEDAEYILEIAEAEGEELPESWKSYKESLEVMVAHTTV